MHVGSVQRPLVVGDTTIESPYPESNGFPMNRGRIPTIHRQTLPSLTQRSDWLITCCAGGFRPGGMNEEFNTNETRSRGETERGDWEREARRLGDWGKLTVTHPKQGAIESTTFPHSVKSNK